MTTDAIQFWKTDTWQSVKTLSLESVNEAFIKIEGFGVVSNSRYTADIDSTKVSRIYHSDVYVSIAPTVGPCRDCNCSFFTAESTSSKEICSFCDDPKTSHQLCNCGNCVDNRIVLTRFFS